MDRAEGATCSLGVCNAVGMCVECVGPADCDADQLCEGNQCKPMLCDNGVKDPGEADVDCGGGGCPACETGASCELPSECVTNLCVVGQCSDCPEFDCTPGDYCEAGVCVPQKLGGETCSGVDECASGFCADAVCCDTACVGSCAACDVVVGSCTAIAAGSDPQDECAGADSCNGSGFCACTDGLVNGDETDVDCGGGTCSACPDGAGCIIDDDCENLCVNGSCFGACNNGQLDLGETAIDCGGPTCQPCVDGAACTLPSDCQSGVCNGTCSVPSCVDNVQNGLEPSVDCGQSCPLGCADNEACGDDADCESLVCTLNACQPPSCVDGQLNGSETGTDCGGPSCPDCAVGQGCTLNQDCISSSCINSVCACSPDLQPSNDGSGVNGAVGLPSLVMSEIDPGAYIELFNTTNSPIALANTNEWLCSPFVYDKLSTLAPNVTVPARGYAVIPWPAGFTDPSNSGGEMMLYSSASFGTNTDILDFICWGTYVNTRKFQAEAVGKWQGPCDSVLSSGVIQRNVSSAGITAAHYNTALPPTPMNCAP